METLIDTVEACTLEVGDLTYWGIIETIVELGDSILVFVEDTDEPITFNPFDLVGLLGMVYTESI